MQFGEELGTAFGKDVIGANLMASNFAVNFGQAARDLDEHNDDWTLFAGADIGKTPDGRGGFTEIPTNGVAIRARREDAEGATRISTTLPDCLATGDIVENDKGERYRIGKPVDKTRIIFHAVRISRPVAL